MTPNFCSRRHFLAASAAFGGGTWWSQPARGADSERQRALVAITFDLEMTRNFPKWNDTHWDFEKGNLNEETKRYAAEAARRVKAHGGRMHFFLVGRALEQENVEWLKEIVAAGHAVGNHTYDHVNVKAARPEDAQFRFHRSPWLVEGQSAEEIIRENIRLTSAAMQSRLGIRPAGFRTPGGFANGLTDRPDLRKMLLDLGFKWVSSKYPAHPNSKPSEELTLEIFDGIVKAQSGAQPFAYADDLLEVPMSPISDIGAFRNGRWKLEHFLKAIRMSLEWTIAQGAVFDFLSHPACLYAMDPEFRAIELICAMVDRAGDRARFATLDEIAQKTPKQNHAAVK
jgi:peptidoglycan/xylan/chitin deacetylase (PgdA/CDA1 family)